MCKECHSWPHLPGCPEGPEKLTLECDWRGCIRQLEDMTETDSGYICQKCLEEPSEQE